MQLESKPGTAVRHSRSSVAFGEKSMTKIITLTAAAATALALSACGATVEQKAASGAIAGAVVGGPVGAAVGGAAGTAVGQAQKPN